MVDDFFTISDWKGNYIVRNLPEDRTYKELQGFGSKIITETDLVKKV